MRPLIDSAILGIVGKGLRLNIFTDLVALMFDIFLRKLFNKVLKKSKKKIMENVKTSGAWSLQETVHLLKIMLLDPRQIKGGGGGYIRHQTD